MLLMRKMRNKGSEGNGGGISEIKNANYAGEWAIVREQRPPFSSILRCIEVLLMGSFGVIGWGVRAIGVVRICNGFPFRNPDP